MRVLSIYLSLSYLTLATAIVEGQAPPPNAEQIQRDAQLLFEDLQAHRAQISEGTVDDLTLRLQEEILTVWDRLLDQADRQKPQAKPQSKNPQQQSQNQEPQQSRQENSESNPQPDSSQGQQPMPVEDEESQNAGEQAGQAAGENPSEDPSDRSSEEIRRREKGRLMELQRAERERLMKEVWGKLPPRIRQKLLNASDERYLPAYENQIRDYFRRLSAPENAP